jgi:hypothetical protein
MACGVWCIPERKNVGKRVVRVFTAVIIYKQAKEQKARMVIDDWGGGKYRLQETASLARRNL